MSLACFSFGADVLCKVLSQNHYYGIMEDTRDQLFAVGLKLSSHMLKSIPCFFVNNNRCTGQRLS